MRFSKNVCLNVRNAKPPANSVTEITPKTEFKGAGKINSSSSPHQSNKITAYNRKRGGNREIYIKIDDEDDCNNNKIEEYSAIEDENHHIFGSNGFLNGERFVHGDRLPLINNNVHESKTVPLNLEIQHQLILSSGSVNTSDGFQRSPSNTTITTSSTGDANKQMRFAVTEADFGDDDEEVANGRRAQNEDEEMKFVSADNPGFEPGPYNITDFLVSSTNQQPLRSQSKLTQYLDNKDQQHKQLIGTSAANIFDGGGKENEFRQIDGGIGISKTIQTNNTTIGTNTFSIRGLNNRNIEGGRISYYPQNDMENKTNSYQVMTSTNDRKQKAEQRRKQKLKQLSREKGQIIKPQEQPGYVGDKDVSDIMMLFEIDNRAHKSNSPSATRSGGAIENSNGKKGNKKQKPKQQRISQNGKKGQQLGGGNRQESYASPDDEEEEMDVDIELDTGNGNNNLMEEKPQLPLNGDKQLRDEDPIAIAIIENNILEQKGGETMKETVESVEQQAKKELPTLGKDDKWESPVVKKTQKTLEEQKRKMEEEMAKKKKAEEEGKLKKKNAEIEEMKKKKATQVEEENWRKKKELEEKERKKAENEERKKRQKEERKKKEEERKRMEEEERLKQLEAEKKKEKENAESKNEKKKNEEVAIQMDENMDDGEQKSEQAKVENAEGEMKNKKPAGKKVEKVWCSSSLSAKKQKLKQEQLQIKQKPLLDRIPPCVLAELRKKCGWKNPVTIVSPFCKVGGSSLAESKKVTQQMGEKERQAIWNGPADQWLEQKPTIMSVEDGTKK